MTDARTLFVPDGLEGERVDAALARLFGVSRTKAADLASAGDVHVNHKQAGKSDRVSAGDLLVSRSVHSAHEALAARGADLLFDTPTAERCVPDSSLRHSESMPPRSPRKRRSKG